MNTQKILLSNIERFDGYEMANKKHIVPKTEQTSNTLSKPSRQNS